VTRPAGSVEAIRMLLDQSTDAVDDVPFFGVPSLVSVEHLQ
jgi:hypothetical protein